MASDSLSRLISNTVSAVLTMSIKLKILYQDFTSVKTDLAVITLFKDIIPLKGYAGDIDWLLNAHISSLIKYEKVFGRYKEVVLLNSQEKIPACKILAFGLGKSTNLKSSKIFHAYSALARTIMKIKISEFCLGIFIRELPNINYKNVAENILGGILQELSKAKGHGDFYIKIIEEDESKISILRKLVKQSLQKYNKNRCRIELD